MDFNQVVAKVPVVPLVQAEDANVAVEIARALARGGLAVAEVVLRTDNALECLGAISDKVPEMIVGAGTVLSVDQALVAIDSGARFIVSPGLDENIVATCQGAGIPIYPGIFTPTEIQRAYNLGLDIVKLFPASIAGGIPTIKAFTSVFRTMKFMPTGGITAGNLADYLELPAVIACGGSWLTPPEAIAAGDYATLAKLAEEACAIARQAAGDRT